MGQLSFFLLCLQFARNQMLNIKVRPYTSWLQGFRARRYVTSIPLLAIRA